MLLIQLKFLSKQKFASILLLIALFTSLTAATGAQAKPAQETAEFTAEAAAIAQQPVVSRVAATGPLKVLASNPRYFTDDAGRAILLTGSHTWLNFQDGVLTDPPPAFNYTGFLNYLVQQNHNFFRLWVWESAKYSVEETAPYYLAPMPYLRTGPGNALDGKPKFDVTRFNQAYFDRLRARVIEARAQGFYVSIMLFNGWSVSYPKGQHADNNPWIGHPFNRDNNINGINGDVNGNNSGDEVHTLSNSAVTALQDAYVKKVIDTVNDLDNVLYEIANETNNGSNFANWQYHMIDLIHGYEAQKADRHPVGMTAMWPNGDNAYLYASNAEWISPVEDLNNPPAAAGNKVIISDTDHHCGICGNRQWVWKSFTRGENPIFMDRYDDTYFKEGYDINNSNDVSLRQNMGTALKFAQCMNLAAMTPRGDLTNTTYALAKPTSSQAEYLVYAPNGGNITVDLRSTSGSLAVQWLNPATQAVTKGTSTTGGGQRSFQPPFTGDAVLYLRSVTTITAIPSPYKFYLAAVAQGQSVASVCIAR